MNFHEHVKDLRIRKRITLRQFCAELDLDPSNWSKVERSVNPPPGDARLLAKIAALLDLEGADKQQLLDLADIGRKEIPADIAANPVALGMMPAFFRAARGHKLTPAEMEDFAAEVRKLNTPDKEF